MRWRTLKANRGIDLDLESSLDDPESYRLLARGDTRRVSARWRPDALAAQAHGPEEFEHISAVLALYRPGRWVRTRTNYALRKNGKQEIEPIHP